MNAKSFVISGIVGGIVDFFLGWIFYGMLFKDFFSSDGNENFLMIGLGCLTFGLFTSYIFSKWEQISNWNAGLKAGAIIGLFLGLYYNFFTNAMKPTSEINCQTMALDIAITIVMSAIVGSVIVLVNEKLK